MSQQKSVLLLIFIMAVVSMVVTGITIKMLYSTALNEEKARLVETAQSQARLIEAVARYDAIYSKAYPKGPVAATLSQIVDARKHYAGFGKTGEFTLSRREGNNIVFLLSHRHFDLEKPKPVPFDSEIAEPMRLALSGKSGTVIGLDYRGETVLAAHEPVGELNLGIVAKIDLSEIRSPFIKAGLISSSVAVLAILLGAGLFIKITSPMIRILEESEERFRLLVEGVTDYAIFMLDKTGHIVSWNLGAERIKGYKPHEIIGQHFSCFYSDEDIKNEKPNRALELAKTDGKFEEEGWRVRKDGSKFVASALITALRDKAGHLRGFSKVTRDITERKRAEEELKKRQRLLEETARIGKVGGWEFNFDTGKQTWTEETCHIHEVDLTYDPTVEKGINFYTPASRPIIERAAQRVIEHGEPFDVELEIITAKGNLRSVHVIGQADMEHRRAYGFFQDITERKQAEESLRKSEEKLARSNKMEAMGLMAGGIAHDLNNILSGIVSYPELILMDLPEDSPLRKPIKTIQESGMRAADVVQDLLTMARGVASGQDVLNLNTAVEEYLDSAEHQKLERIHPLNTFKTELDSGLLNITCSASHVNKVLMNLVTNASEAIEGSGMVTISTENRYLDEPLRGYEDVVIGEYVVLTVSDDGSGISPQDLERIFEPFYTKKVMGRSGTGLGLAVVWNMIQDHAGYINVKTGKKGTAFELYFPITRDEVISEGEAVPVKDYMGHGDRILVVDDEEIQRKIACGILTKLGYDAEAVSSGEEAVEYLKEQSVDLVVLDMIMPKGINGRETYEKIIEIHPGQKAIIASGYAETPDVKKAQKLGAGKYIKKPYTMQKIGVAVKEELEK